MGMKMEIGEEQYGMGKAKAKIGCAKCGQTNLQLGLACGAGRVLESQTARVQLA